MATNRRIYQTSLLYVGPTGANSCTGAHSLAGNGQSGSAYGNIVSATSGVNLIAELFRVQSVNDNWNKNLTDVNQFGELGAIDRVPISPPTVSLSYNYLLANLVNENLIGLTVGKAGDAALVSCVSGILNNTTDMKNYFVKTVGEGNDAIDYNPSSYDVISLGNCYVNSYTSQGSVGQFPTVDISLEALNIQQQSVTHAVGAYIPAVVQSDGTAITGWGYNLPTGLTSFNNLGLTNNVGISVLRPGDISLSLGLGAGDGFVSESDIKIQSYNVSFSLNREDLQKLGSKYAYAKLPRFPATATMSVTALVGDFQTGSLVEIVNNNKDFNPSVTIKKPGDATTTIVYYQLRGAKLDNQDFSENVGSNQTITMNFATQISGPQSPNGLVMSGIINP